MTIKQTETASTICEYYLPVDGELVKFLNLQRYLDFADPTDTPKLEIEDLEQILTSNYVDEEAKEVFNAEIKCKDGTTSSIATWVNHWIDIKVAEGYKKTYPISCTKISREYIEND